MSKTTKVGETHCFDEHGNEVPFPLTRRTISLPPDFPRIVCLCGSTRFKEQYIRANFEETMKGNIVLSVGLYSHADKESYSPTEEEKKALDELHKRKLDLCDEVLVLNCKRPRCVTCGKWWMQPVRGLNGFPDCKCWPEVWGNIPYIGDSTLSEIDYALAAGKPVRYLEEPS